MTVIQEQLGETLKQAFHGEPPVADGIEAVYRRAEIIHRRRLRTVISSGVAAVLLVIALGYGLTTAILPGSASRGVASPTAGSPPTPPADPVLAAVRTVIAKDLRVVPREPVRGDGWRQYTVLSRESGHPRGLIEVSAYAAPDGICFPVLADDDACARPDRAGDDVEYVRYADDRDVEWQVNEAIARRSSDGRVVAVQATGERGTTDAEQGRPPLTGPQTARLAADPRLLSAFGAEERCNGPNPACPLLSVPVRLPA